MLLYCFDLKIKGLKAYNTLKRRFYYSLSKQQFKPISKITKSVFLVEDSYEKSADSFFSQFGDFIEVYKVRITNVERLF